MLEPTWNQRRSSAGVALGLLLAFLALSACGAESQEDAKLQEQAELPGKADSASADPERQAREDAVIRYQGMPGMVKLPAPYGGRSHLDFETGLPRRSCGCIVVPGQREKDAAHNARIRAACARGELRRFQLKHKFTRIEDMHERFSNEAGLLLAPGKPVEAPDHTYRIEVRSVKYPNSPPDSRYWRTYVQAGDKPVRPFSLFGKVGEEWRVLFDHENTTILVKKRLDQFEVHDVPTGVMVQQLRAR